MAPLHHRLDRHYPLTLLLHRKSYYSLSFTLYLETFFAREMATARDLSEVEQMPSLLPQRINLSDYTQAELRALADANNAKIHSSSPGGEEVIPKLGPGFNESAASHGQITCTLDAGARCWTSRHRRFSSRYPCAKLPDSEEEDRENRMIVSLFKKCMQEKGDGDREEVQDSRKRKLCVAGTSEASPFGEVGLQVVNKNGDVVDLKNLSKADALYEQELRRRTAGMATEVELLGFLNSLEGKWGSTRRKRRIVDASLLEDAFPVGWKIIIALRKKDGLYSPFCRQFISPTGEQFLSCVEAASFLSSHFGISLDERREGDDREAVEKSSGKKPVTEDTSSNTAILPTSSVPSSSRVVAGSGAGSPGSVVVHDTYECRECNASYNSKDAHLRHVLLFHRKTTRKYQGTPVGKGVIVRDGKYVCQFCNKVFLVKRSYTCHVGVHVRNFNRGTEDLFEEESIDPEGMSAMQAMAVIARRVMKAKSVPAISSSSVSDVPNPAADGI